MDITAFLKYHLYVKDTNDIDASAGIYLILTEISKTTQQRNSDLQKLYDQSLL